LALEAVKAAVVKPDGTVTEGGRETAELLETRLTRLPVEGAGPLKVTVHPEVPGVITESGEQVRLLSVTGAGTQFCTVMVPPVPDTVVALPSGRAPMTSTIPTGIDALLVKAASSTVTIATTPLPMELEFIPVARQTMEPLVVLQVTVLLAAVRTGPVAVLTEMMSPGA
jgi:hypothetical protein